jgi:hypothetical protein
LQTKNLTSLTSFAPAIGVTGHSSALGSSLDRDGLPGVDFLSFGSDHEESQGGLASGLIGTAAATSTTEAAATLFALAGVHAPVEAVISLNANSNRASGDARRVSSAAALRFWRTVSASRRRSHGLTAEGTLVAFTD